VIKVNNLNKKKNYLNEKKIPPGGGIFAVTKPDRKVGLAARKIAY